jgi:preprotein translocase subunit YajC
MTFDTLKVMLADAAQVAQAPQATGVPGQTQMVEDQRAASMKSLGLMAMLFVVMYLFLIRPQQKKAKEQQKINSTVKAGDKIVTTSGIVGVVISVKDKTLSIRSADAKLEITKGAVAEITERSGEAPATSVV